MSVREAAFGGEGALPARSEIAARVRDYLRRRASGLNTRLDALARYVEEAVETSLSLGRLKSALALLRGRLSRAAAAVESEPRAVSPELEALLRAVAEHRDPPGIDEYGEYLFTIEPKL